MVDDKIKFIVENIDTIENTSEIITYINLKQLNYSKNVNGLFLNLTMLEDEDIEAIYEIINNIKNDTILDLEIIIIPEKKSKAVDQNYESLKLNPLQEKMLSCVF